MISEQKLAVIYAILAAVLFGGCAPIAKYLLDGIEPIILAGLLYLGSGFGLLAYLVLNRILSGKRDLIEASLQKSDIPWLFGVVFFGGFLAPVILMYSLVMTPAATASLLLNFEAVATTIIAFFFFREAIGKQIWAALGLITLSCIILTWDPQGNLGFSIYAFGILICCTLWALDNNFSRNISSKDPVPIVCIKGLGAGTLSVIAGLFIGQSLPPLNVVITAMMVGFFAYGGLTSVLFLLALREIGTSRTGSFLAIAPFFGVAISFVMYSDNLGMSFILSLPLMIAGACLLIFEKHSHMHHHNAKTHEHRHRHNLHHIHEHGLNDPLITSSGEHSHVHSHVETDHEHSHTPDIHHRHKH
ncbi:MAG: EamA family transporter [Methanomicrobiaceae archaeon]|nr:EamA family transporter [Methanomicrobiaceae archaeon]